MARVIDGIEDARKMLPLLFAEKTYLVGAGELGQYLGEYLIGNGLEWAAYIDGSKSGSLNGHDILSYDENGIALDAWFVITSPLHTEGMKRRLKSIGVDAERIVSFESNRVIYELYGEVNMLMGKLLGGVYRECSFGEKNPDKVYMILERSMIYEGILSNVRRFLMGIDYADRNGFVPAIDQVYYPAFEYQDYESVGTDNPWEYFFKQPGGVGLREIVQGCRTARYYNMDDTINMKYLSEPLSLSGGVIARLEHWHRLTEEYLHLTDEMEMLVEAEYKRLFPENAKVLGTKVREGMMRAVERKCNRGAVACQPEVDEIIADIKAHMTEWDCEYVYLMCETVEIKNRFDEEFGSRLLCLERNRLRYEDLPDASEIRLNVLHDKEMDKSKNAREYLVEVYLLAKCDALISGDNGASEMACVIKGGYDHMILYDRGFTSSFTA